MAALIAFRDQLGVFADTIHGAEPIELVGGTVTAGSLRDLLTRQLERGVRIRGDQPGYNKFELKLNVPFGMAGSDGGSLAGVRLIALLGIAPLPRLAHATPNPRYQIYGRSNTSGALELLGEASGHRIIGSDPESGLVNRIIALPAAGQNGRDYTQYVVRFMYQSHPAPEVQIGRIWVSNAIQVPDGVDADWSWSVTDAGRVDVSRGGQAYVRPASVLRTLRANISGPGLDARLAFGHGVTPAPGGVRRDSDWLSDAATHIGTTGNIIVVPRASDASWVNRTAIYGRLREPVEIEHAGGDYYSTRLSVVEER